MGTKPAQPETERKCFFFKVKVKFEAKETITLMYSIHAKTWQHTISVILLNYNVTELTNQKKE